MDHDRRAGAEQSGGTGGSVPSGGEEEGEWRKPKRGGSPPDCGIIERACDCPDATHKHPRGGRTNLEREPGPVSGGGGTQGSPGLVRKGSSQGLSGVGAIVHRSTIREW